MKNITRYASVCALVTGLLILCSTFSRTKRDSSYGEHKEYIDSKLPVEELYRGHKYDEAQSADKLDTYSSMWESVSDLKEYWLYLHSLMNVSELLRDEKITIDEGYVALRSKLEGVVGKSRIEREIMMKKLRNLVQDKLHRLQNPEDCNKARVLLCDIHSPCGFGCYLHFIVNCLMRAFESERTMIYRDKENWKYADEGWELGFMPISVCKDSRDANTVPKISDDTKNERVVSLNSNNVAAWIHWRIPTSLAPTLERINGDPFAWWIGQFVWYAFRPQPWLREKIASVQTHINYTEPMAGIQIRRGDKLNHIAGFHDVEEYMFFVEKWYDQLDLERGEIKRAVYIATEDETVLPEMIKKYPNYIFIMSNMVDRSAKDTRHGKDALEAIALDIHFLSRSNFLTCTLSSNICRAAYELMMYLNADASNNFQSVDSLFRFKQNFNFPWRAVADHIPRSVDEIELRVDDIIAVSLDPRLPANDGYLRGTNKRTKMTGKFPAYKARKIINYRDFPILE